jgi:hypothetical protein
MLTDFKFKSQKRKRLSRKSKISNHLIWNLQALNNNLKLLNGYPQSKQHLKEKDLSSGNI